MKDGGRLAAAIEILTEVDERHRPVQEALKDWGNAHRFAGSGDRTIIGNLVFDALRHKRSLGWRMRSDTPRAIVLATYALSWALGPDRLQAVLAEDRHAPEAVSADEAAALQMEPAERAPDAVAADVPDWLWPVFAGSLGAGAVREGQELAARAPIDMRVNTLKATREKVARRLQHIGVRETPLSPVGLRVEPRPGPARLPHVQAEEGYRKGWFELQDEASQLVALVAGAQPGRQVLDFCAGGGGKTLALAARMENRGQIYAFDSDRIRLAPIHERLARAGARNVQVRPPHEGALDDLAGHMDLVFVDAPCTGTGVWRRRPDSKWRLTERALAERVEDQARVLEAAARFVRPGGLLAYVTCSVLVPENRQQVAGFLSTHCDFETLSAAEAWTAALPGAPLPAHVSPEGHLTLTPATTGTDGFFIALLRRKPA
ncbi:RsmB/NOP family class I SAM-dependent RNA methyltransferase [Polymorphum gilvum]|uniref:Probable Sun protein (FMU protein), (Ribosomal RNA small subunit methyltransferase B, rRNA (Cytosine-C(5)-)-methyltransferase) n=1 Tax=Polymorphum gilvum (strain LMG 25793 / CGMCC 1.9160 / SL003B-26A1) TaxID=991905 RepID=F2J1Q7_POLGS|nr:RsmB/NOP family class I SAM-dependent RNA methyltransferase [Polymorphum gilvum]ADZ70858.1 Probable Sun protein (FMU protein), (Ribosomal RNA small subunit methyltransferase B, rRNA (Cytosine-C(5)-)-methyltransferase) [Polymorphum gilvum SL003B-26A1]